VDRPGLPSEPKAPGFFGLSGVGPVDGVKARRKRLCAVKADAEAVVSPYSVTVPQPLEAMTTEERHRLYRMLHLSVRVNPDGKMDVRGTLKVCNKNNIP
jgi:hypothetical protein